MAAKKALAELLVSSNLLDLEQLEQARRDQKANGGRLTTSIVRLGFLKDSQLVEFLGQQYGLPTIELFGFEVDPEALKMLTRQVCDKHMVIPLSKAGKSLVVAFADPSNIYVKDDLALLTRCKIEAVIASESAILAAIDKYYGGNQKIENLISEIEDSADTARNMVEMNVEVVDQAMSTDEGPIVKFVNAMLAEAIKTRTSDIHIEPYEKRFRIRFRIDGALVEKTQPPANAAAAIVSRIKILSRLDIGERRKPQDGRMKVKMRNGVEIDFRVSCLPTIFGEKVVMRLLDKSNLQVDMTKLGFEQDDFQTFLEAIRQPQGMILITGPTGSGKTTTIYSALNELNKPDVNVSTAEDPVEYNLDGINQVQVNPAIGFTFAEALRSFLRQDPEIVMVGEIRDLETAEVAFKAASTGHLVVSTLHTNDAPSTVARLVEIGVEPYVVSEATSIVVAQRLLRRNCPKCSVEHRIPREVLLKIGIPEKEIEAFKGARKGEGCEECNGTGLKGRMAIFELLTMTSGVKEAIYKGASPMEIKREAMNGGMRTLRQAAILKMKAGQTTLEEVLNTTIPDLT
ncbi:MAG: type IV-A pilus assembly ATPase PilB [Bdellovibrionales bacterium]|nr:type IV-A pilus assembly ATPase PilB [Bdellovibrionales bacterium]